MLKAIISDKLIRTGGILFIASMLTNVFHYLLQVVMGRLFIPSDYGLMNSLFSMLMVMSVPAGTILMMVAKYTSELKATARLGWLNSLFSQSYIKILIPGMIGFAVYIAASPFIRDYLHAPSVVPVMLIGVAFVFSLALPINVGIIQGMQNFRWLNISTAIAGPLKFSLCVLFVLLGLGVNGAVAGFVSTCIILWLLTFVIAKSHLSQDDDIGERFSMSFGNVMYIFVANFSFGVITQSDMILVKHFFSPYEAGIYASAAILGKAVMYLPGALALVLFPMVAASHASNDRCSHLILKAILVCLAISGACALFLMSFPEWVIVTLFSAKYLGSAPLLRYFGIAMLPMALLIVIMNYFVARGRRFFCYLMTLFAFAEIILITLFHEKLLSVVITLIIVGSALLITSLLLIYIERRTEQKQYGFYEQRVF